jgi:hypothetical protein
VKSGCCQSRGTPRARASCENGVYSSNRAPKAGHPRTMRAARSGSTLRSTGPIRSPAHESPKSWRTTFCFGNRFESKLRFAKTQNFRTFSGSRFHNICSDCTVPIPGPLSKGVILWNNGQTSLCFATALHYYIKKTAIAAITLLACFSR